MQMSMMSIAGSASRSSNDSRAPLDAELVADRRRAALVEVADRRHPERRVRQVALDDVRAADVEADEADVSSSCDPPLAALLGEHLRLQRDLHRLEAARLRHRRLGAVADVGEELAPERQVGRPSSRCAARPPCRSGTGGRCRPARRRRRTCGARSCLGADDDQPPVAPGGQAVRGEPVDADHAGRGRRARGACRRRPAARACPGSPGSPRAPTAPRRRRRR